MNSLAFKSKIHFVNHRTYMNMPLQYARTRDNVVGEPWTEEQIVNADAAFTERIQSCTAGGITNGKIVTMFHMDPKKCNVKNFDRFEQKMEEGSGLKANDSSKLNGLIIGGQYNIEEDNDYIDRNENVNGRPLFEKIKKFFESNNITHSIIWGQDRRKDEKGFQQNGGINLSYATNYDKVKDTWFVQVYDTRTKINSIEDLKNTFKYISISPKDQLYINGEKIPREQLKKLDLTG